MIQYGYMGIVADGRPAIRVGRFVERELERSYRVYELDSDRRSVSLVVPLLGVVFLGFGALDYITLPRDAALVALLSIRALFFALAVAVPRLVRSSEPLGRRELALGAVTAAGIAAFCVSLFVYRDQDPYLQAASVLLVINAQYLIPNRFSFSVVASLIVAAAGAVSLVYGHGALSPSVMNAFVVDFVLMALLSALIWLRTCRSRRREYSKSLELEYISKTDQLTGLGNRRYLAERYAEAKARMMRYGEGSAIIMADLDYFKALNDNYGHEEGDKVLKEASRRFSESLRSEDSLCRWGGEEFVALISYATLDAALESAKRLQSALRSTPMEVVGTVRASFGVTMVGTDETLDDTVARADRALYRAKNAGRDRVELEP